MSEYKPTHSWSLSFTAIGAARTMARLDHQKIPFDVYEYVYYPKKGPPSDWRAYAVLGKGKDISIVRDGHVSECTPSLVTEDHVKAIARTQKNYFEYERMDNICKAYLGIKDE